MPNLNKRTTIVGTFIRSRRESVGLSQRALGLMFSPPVTTQFISNIERGVTPLPLCHVSTLTKALSMRPEEITTLLEKEFTHKLSGRLPSELNGHANGHTGSLATIFVETKDADFFNQLTGCYKKLNESQRGELYSTLQHFFQEKLGDQAKGRFN